MISKKSYIPISDAKIFCSVRTLQTVCTEVTNAQLNSQCKSNNSDILVIRHLLFIIRHLFTFYYSLMIECMSTSIKKELANPTHFNRNLLHYEFNNYITSKNCSIIVLSNQNSLFDSIIQYSFLFNSKLLLITSFPGYSL